MGSHEGVEHERLEALYSRWNLPMSISSEDMLPRIGLIGYCVAQACELLWTIAPSNVNLGFHAADPFLQATCSIDYPSERETVLSEQIDEFHPERTETRMHQFLNTDYRVGVYWWGKSTTKKEGSTGLGETEVTYCTAFIALVAVCEHHCQRKALQLNCDRRASANIVETIESPLFWYLNFKLNYNMDIHVQLLFVHRRNTRISQIMQADLEGTVSK